MIKIFRSPTNPKLISILPGSICNLACVLCGPNHSTRWQHELGVQKKEDLDFDITKLDFSDVNTVKISGGEPILHKSTVEILKKLNRSTWLMIHFNGTVLPSAEFLKVCSEFRNVDFIFSIDGIEKQFDFMRWPANWSTVTKNIQWFKDNCPGNIKFQVNTTLCVLNQSSYYQVEDWVKTYLPTNSRGIETIFYTNESNDRLNRFTYKNHIKEEVEFLDQLDKKRNTNWRELFPEAAELLKC